MKCDRLYSWMLIFLLLYLMLRTQVVSLNAEGKARSDDQLRTLIATVDCQTHGEWLVLSLLEADFCDDEGKSDSLIDGHMCIRNHVVAGRAQKAVVNRKYLDRFVCWSWWGRSFRADFQFGTSDRAKPVSVLSSHFAHGEAWWNSLDEMASLLATMPPRTEVVANGDYNLEFRPNHQTSTEKE